MVLFNFVFRLVSTFLIERLRFGTVSGESSVVMILVFSLQFFNTAIQIPFDNMSTVEMV